MEEQQEALAATHTEMNAFHYETLASPSALGLNDEGDAEHTAPGPGHAGFLGRHAELKREHEAMTAEIQQMERDHARMRADHEAMIPAHQR